MEEILELGRKLTPPAQRGLAAVPSERPRYVTITACTCKRLITHILWRLLLLFETLVIRQLHAERGRWRYQHSSMFW